MRASASASYRSPDAGGDARERGRRPGTPAARGRLLRRDGVARGVTRSRRRADRLGWRRRTRADRRGETAWAPMGARREATGAKCCDRPRRVSWFGTEKKPLPYISQPAVLGTTDAVLPHSRRGRGASAVSRARARRARPDGVSAHVRGARARPLRDRQTRYPRDVRRPPRPHVRRLPDDGLAPSRAGRRRRAHPTRAPSRATSRSSRPSSSAPPRPPRAPRPPRRGLARPPRDPPSRRGTTNDASATPRAVAARAAERLRDAIERASRATPTASAARDPAPIPILSPPSSPSDAGATRDPAANHPTPTRTRERRPAAA